MLVFDEALVRATKIVFCSGPSIDSYVPCRRFPTSGIGAVGLNGNFATPVCEPCYNARLAIIGRDGATPIVHSIDYVLATVRNALLGRRS